MSVLIPRYMVSLLYNFYSKSFIASCLTHNDIIQDIIQFISVTKLCLTLCDPVDCSTPALPVHHQLSEFTETHVHHISDAVQPSHPLSSPSPPTFNLS